MKLAMARASKVKADDESGTRTRLFETPSADPTTSGPRADPHQVRFLQCASRGAVV